MKRVWELIKKYWKIVTGAIITFIIFVLYSKKDRGFDTEVETEVKTLDKKNDELQNDIKKIEVQKEDIKTNIKINSDKVAEIDKKLNTASSETPKASTDAEIEYLKGLGKNKN